MKKFLCSCGATISPPRISPTMFLGETTVDFIAIGYRCPNCQKHHTTNYGERKGKLRKKFEAKF